MPQPKATASDLKRVRESRNWSQDEMANHLDVTRSYYNQVESGSRELKGKLLKRAAIMLKGMSTKEHSESLLVNEQPAPYGDIGRLNILVSHADEDAEAVRQMNNHLENYVRVGKEAGASPQLIADAIRRNLRLSEFDYLVEEAERIARARVFSQSPQNSSDKSDQAETA